jgi:hypothetical protein
MLGYLTDYISLSPFNLTMPLTSLGKASDQLVRALKNSQVKAFVRQPLFISESNQFL